MSSTILISKQNVPQYLSPQYANFFLDVDGDAEEGRDITVEVPGDCLKPNPQIDLRELLITTRYWLIPEFF